MAAGWHLLRLGTVVSCIAPPAGSNLGGLAQPLIMCYTEKSRSKQQNSMEMTRVTDVLTLHLLI